MSLLDSLLDAIIRLDGDVLVMHVGEKPYVVTPSEGASEFRGPLAWGHVELSSRVLTSEAMLMMLDQMLPAAARAGLDEFGVAEHDVAAASDSAERFAIVAARGGDDIWVEVRRQSRHPAAAGRAVEQVAEFGSGGHQAAAPTAVAAPPETPHVSHVPADGRARADAPAPAKESTASPPDRQAAATAPPAVSFDAALSGDDEEVLGIDVSYGPDEFDPEPYASERPLMPVHAPGQDWGDDVMTEQDLNELLGASISVPAEPDSCEVHVLGDLDGDLADWDRDLGGDAGQEGADDPTAPQRAGPPTPDLIPAPAADVRQAECSDNQVEPVDAAPIAPTPETAWSETTPAMSVAGKSFVADAGSPASAAPSEESVLADESRNDPPAPVAAHTGDPGGTTAAPVRSPDTSAGRQEVPSRPGAVIVPLPRQRAGTPAETGAPGESAFARLLRLAASRGASAVYVVADTAPMIRVDGEFTVLEGEAALSTASVERLLADLTPEESEAAHPHGWTAMVPEVGRVRCQPFRDRRGPGAIVRMMPPRSIAADQLGLPPEVQALCSEADGLVVVAGGPGSGRSTLLTSFVDVVNRGRSDHVISVESRIEFVHESGRSFISQREVREGPAALADAVGAALCEEPDVLVIDDLATPELVALALRAAESGRLVFAAVTASSAVAAVERILEMSPAGAREQARAALAGTLRGVVAQMVLRRLTGGRVAAREMLINTAEVAALIRDGRTPELADAIENGRRHGMISFAECLARLVREGSVHASHAQRKAPDSDRLAASLRRADAGAPMGERPAQAGG